VIGDRDLAIPHNALGPRARRAVFAVAAAVCAARSARGASPRGGSPRTRTRLVDRARRVNDGAVEPGDDRPAAAARSRRPTTSPCWAGSGSARRSTARATTRARCSCGRSEPTSSRTRRASCAATCARSTRRRSRHSPSSRST
jgi:hypothetical protein